jgi:hypothetical protein
MPGLSERELVRYLDDLIQATTDGLIQWRPANPTSYIWDKDEPPRARLLLQQAPFKSERYSLHVFEVYEDTPIKTREEIDGRTSEVINERLGRLFAFVRDKYIQQDLDFLRGTLPRRKEN